MIELFSISFSKYYGYGFDLLAYSNGDSNKYVKSLLGVTYHKNEGVLILDILYMQRYFK